jgi:hypothetical protein
MKNFNKILSLLLLTSFSFGATLFAGPKRELSGDDNNKRLHTTQTRQRMYVSQHQEDYFPTKDRLNYAARNGDIAAISQLFADETINEQITAEDIKHAIICEALANDQFETVRFLLADPRIDVNSFINEAVMNNRHDIAAAIKHFSKKN